MKTRNLFYRILFLLCLIFMYYLFRYFLKNPGYKALEVDVSCEKYKQSCLKLFKKLRFPDPSLIFSPPLRKPPEKLHKLFEQNGKMPISKFIYINEAYPDAISNQSNTQINVIKISDINKWRTKVKNREQLHYYDLNLRRAMFNHSSFIRQKTFVVIGTQVAWIEAIALELSASKITTLEYTRKSYEQKELEWLHVYDYLEYLLENNLIEQFENAASYSSIDHSGLGRYGEPLSPYGDVEAVAQIHCMIKPNGYFFLGLPTSKDDSSYIEFNTQRIYGESRLELLLDGWKVIDKAKNLGDTFDDTLFILQKLNACY